MLTQAFHRVGMRGWIFHGMSLGSVFLCLLLWQRAKTVDQDERG